MMMVLEDQPRLNITALKAWGLLTAKPAEVAIQWGRTFGSSTLKAALIWRPDLSILKIHFIFNDDAFGQDICIQTIKGRFRQRTYIICPGTGARCEDLYFMNGCFGSRKTHGLVYKSQAGARPAYSGLAKWKVLVAPPSAPEPQPGWARPTNPVRQRTPEELERDQIRRERRRAVRDNGMDTESALVRGEASPFKVDVDWYEKEFAEGLSGYSSNPPHRPLDDRFKIELWEDWPRLDIRVLVRRGMLKAGALTGAVMSWKPPSPMEEAHLFIDLRRPNAQHIGVVMAGYEETTFQTIALIRPSEIRRQRYLMRCAYSYDGVEVMAYREGRFGTRRSQRLINASQRSSNRAPG